MARLQGWIVIREQIGLLTFKDETYICIYPTAINPIRIGGAPDEILLM